MSITELDKYIISKVKEMRLKADLSGPELSMALGKNNSFIGHFEAPSNKKKKYNVYNLNDIARALGCSPKDFMPDKPLEGPPIESTPPSRTKKSRLSLKIEELIKADFFQDGKKNREVVDYLKENTDLEVDSSKTSLVLRGFVLEGKLTSEKVGSLNVYATPKK